MKDTISRLARDVYFSNFAEDLLNGEFDKIITIDMDKVVARFNAGDYSVLDDEQVKLFLRKGAQTPSFTELLLNISELLRYKNVVMKDIQEKKNNFSYRSSDEYNHSAVYGTIVDAIEMAETILKSEKLYQTLRFYLRYESLIKDMTDRRAAIYGAEKNAEKREKLLEVLKKEDHQFGIVKVFDTENGDYIAAGTRRDMEMSEIIGAPFPANMYRESYDYGPHGDYFMPEKRVSKMFYEPETALHQAMVKSEKLKRKALSLPRKNEQGFIKNKSGSTILISRKELIDGGVIPETVGWKPLRLEVKPMRLSSLKKVHYWYGEEKLSHKDRLSLQRGLILKGKIRIANEKKEKSL